MANEIDLGYVQIKGAWYKATAHFEEEADEAHKELFRKAVEAMMVYHTAPQGAFFIDSVGIRGETAHNPDAKRIWDLSFGKKSLLKKVHDVHRQLPPRHS